MSWPALMAEVSMLDRYVKEEPGSLSPVALPDAIHALLLTLSFLLYLISRADWVSPLPRPSRPLLSATTARPRLRATPARLLKAWLITSLARDTKHWGRDWGRMAELYKKRSRVNVTNT